MPFCHQRYSIANDIHIYTRCSGQLSLSFPRGQINRVPASAVVEGGHVRLCRVAVKLRYSTSCGPLTCMRYHRCGALTNILLNKDSYCHTPTNTESFQFTSLQRNEHNHNPSIIFSRVIFQQNHNYTFKSWMFGVRNNIRKKYPFQINQCMRDKLSGGDSPEESMSAAGCFW